MITLWLVTLSLSAIAAVLDWRRGHIPNWLTGLALGTALVGHAVLGFGRAGVRGAAIEVGWSLAGVVVCGAPLFWLFVRGVLGGGDLKLFAAIGALLHPMAGLEVEVHAYVVAVVIALGQLVHRGVLLETLRTVLRLVVRPFRKDRRVKAPDAGPHLLQWFPLGPSIFAGVVVSFLFGGR